MTSVVARPTRTPTMDKAGSAAGAMNAPPHPRYPSNSRRSHSRDFHPQVSPISSQSPDVQRRSYSPLSDADQAILPNDNATMPPPASDASSALSDIQDESDDLSTRSHSGTPSHSSELATDSDNETEAETERLHISPQKARDQIIDEGLEDNQDEATNGTAIVRPGLRPQDILSDEIEEDPQTSDSESSRAGEHGLRSPNALAGHKRKRNGALSPTMGHSSPDGQSPRKRSSIRRSFGLQAPKQPAEDVELADAVDAVLSSSEDEEDAIRKIELARHGSLTPAPEIEEQLDAARVEVETEEAVEADNEDDEAEAAAKTEDDVARKKQAYDQFKPLEKLFAIFRDKVFNEKWAELTAELELVNNPNTTHADFLAMRQAVDARRDEKKQLEQVALQYKIKNLEKQTLSKRSLMHCHYYQTIRDLRDNHLTRLNADYCQIQRERRHFIRKEPHFVYKFEDDRPKHVEQQTRYNKEVSLLSGIARHKGFPGAPNLANVPKDDMEDDFQAMMVHQAATRAVSYNELAQSARASEVAAGDQFLADTPWANPNHPSNKRAHVLEAQNVRIPVATPPPPQAQPWMLNTSVPSTEARPIAQHAISEPRRTRTLHDGGRSTALPETSSPFATLKRTTTTTSTGGGIGEPQISWRDNAQAHLASRFSNNTTPRVDKSPFETRATKTSASYPIDAAGLAQGFVGGPMARVGSFGPGTPGAERESSVKREYRARTPEAVELGVR